MSFMFGGGSQSPWESNDASSLFPEDSQNQGYGLSQESFGGSLGQSQGESQSQPYDLLSQYGLSQLSQLSQSSQPAVPTCTECQSTDFDTTDQGDMVSKAERVCSLLRYHLI